jgi:hypothetical protein
MNKFTRRELAAGLATSAVLLGQPAPPPLPATPDEELKAVREQLRDAADQLDKFPLPMSTEPATTFHP